MVVQMLPVRSGLAADENCPLNLNLFSLINRAKLIGLFKLSPQFAAGGASAATIIRHVHNPDRTGACDGFAGTKVIQKQPGL